MSKEDSFSVILYRKNNGSCGVNIRPYNPSKTVKLPEALYRRLAHLAQKLMRSRHSLMVEAIKQFIDREEGH